MNTPIQTSLGTYYHSTMAPEFSIFAAPKTSKPRKASKRISIGASVLFYGKPATVIANHPTKGWWTVQFEDGRTASGDRKDCITFP